MTHADLVMLAERWLYAMGCGVVIFEQRTFSWEQPDALAWKSNESILVECKTSRSDFHADRKRVIR